MANVSSRTVSTVVLLCTALLLAACGGGDAAPSGGAPSASVEPDDGDAGEAAGEAAAAEPDPTDPSCLVGTWKVDNASLENAFESMLPAELPGATFTLVGDDLLRFFPQEDVADPNTQTTYARGEYSSIRDVAMIVTASDRPGQVEYRFEGAETGRYSAAEGLIWIGDLLSLFDRSTMVMDAGGVRREMVLSEGSADVTIIFPGGSFSTTVEPPSDEDVDIAAFYSCLGDRLEFTSGDVPVVLGRVPDDTWPTDLGPAGP
jgi:hypothetical protein